MKKLAVLCLTLVMLSFCIPVKVMAEGDEGQVEYTVVYWQQLISDDKTLSDAEKHYKNAGVVQKTAVAGTQVTPEMAADIPVGFYLNTVRSDKSITPRKYGSVRLNVYLDRELITMTFNSANGDTENVYTGLYGQSLAQNGYIWPQGLWSYINDEGSSMFMSYLGDFILSITGTSITFTKNSGDNRNIYFYLQNLDGTYDNTATFIGGGTNGNVNFYLNPLNSNPLLAYTRQWDKMCDTSSFRAKMLKSFHISLFSRY